jgi:hypothetical protein
MMKKYIPDVVIILVILTTAFLIAERPRVDLKSAPSAMGATGAAVQATEIKREQLNITRPADEIKELKARNLFSASGTYAETAEKPLPENPYTLIAVLRGKEMKAVFKDYSGSIMTRDVGNKMIDGAVITGIGNTTVKLKKGTEITEMRIFNVQRREPSARK